MIGAGNGSFLFEPYLCIFEGLLLHFHFTENKHNATQEEYWKYADEMEEKGDADFKWSFCQSCGYSSLDYSTSPPGLICKKLGGLVSPYDTCKYATIDKKITNIISSVANASSSGDGGNSKSGRSGGSGGCYVATAVYGSYDCPAVWTLRRFRDTILAKSTLGSIFIRIYYAVSPGAVKKFGKNKLFQSFWRYILDRLVLRLNANGVSSEPYQDR